MVNDPVGDFIIRIKNAGNAKLATLTVPYSNLKMAIAEVLKSTGFIEDVEKTGKKVKKSIVITLKEGKGGKAFINNVKRISKPGRRIYKSTKEIFPVRFGKGALILSTPKGILTGTQAKKENVGGEALFEIH